MSCLLSQISLRSQASVSNKSKSLAAKKRTKLQYWPIHNRFINSPCLPPQSADEHDLGVNVKHFSGKQQESTSEKAPFTFACILWDCFIVEYVLSKICLRDFWVLDCKLPLVSIWWWPCAEPSSTTLIIIMFFLLFIPSTAVLESLPATDLISMNSFLM